MYICRSITTGFFVIIFHKLVWKFINSNHVFKSRPFPNIRFFFRNSHTIPTHGGIIKINISTCFLPRLPFMIDTFLRVTFYRRVNQPTFFIRPRPVWPNVCSDMFKMPDLHEGRYSKGDGKTFYTKSVRLSNSFECQHGRMLSDYADSANDQLNACM